MAPTQRIVTCVVKTPAREPWPYATIRYELDRDSFTEEATFPTEPILSTADETGNSATALWCNGEGLRPTKYTYFLPDGGNGEFVLPAGDTPISLEALRILTGIPRWLSQQLPPLDEALIAAIYAAFANTSNPLLGDYLSGAKATGTGATPRTVHDVLGDLCLLNNYDTLADALTAADGKTLVINRAELLESNTTIPATVSLRVERNGRFTIASGQTLTINGPLEAGPWQIFAGSGAVVGGVVDAVYPEWFGVTGDGTTNDTAALTTAIIFAAGREVLFTQPLYRARNLAFTTVPVIKLRALHDATIQHLYDGLLYDETLLSVSNFTRIEMRGLTLDCNETCARCANIANLTPFSDPDDIRSVTVEGCRFINGKQYLAGTYPVAGTDRAIGLRVQGYVTTLDVINKNEFNNFYSVDSTKPIARGILVARASDGGSVSVTRIIDNDFENIGPSDDGDAIQIISADPPANSVALVTHNRFRNCAKRSFKSQCASSVFTHNYTYRDRPFPQESDADEGEEGPGCEVSILRGGGIVAHNRAYYESGAMPPMFVAINTMVESPTIVESNNIWCADPDDVMHRFVHLAAIVTDQGETVQRGSIIRGNVANVQMEYFCRIRPEAFTSNSGYNIDGLVIEDNQVQTLTRALISLERSGPSGGFVNVRGVVRRNRHFGAAVRGIIFRYSNVTFTLTDWSKNDNIEWWSSSSNGSDNSRATTEIWETLAGQIIDVNATSGTFTVSGNSNTTAGLAYNADAATVQAAIQGLGGSYATATLTGPTIRNPSTAPNTRTYAITLPFGSPAATLTASAAGLLLTGGTPTVDVINATYQYSGDEYEIDWLPAQALYHDYQRETGAAYGVVRFTGTTVANQTITCRVKHDGRGVFNVRAAFHVPVGAGGAFADRAARMEFSIINESTQLLLNSLHNTNTSAGYAGAWTVAHIDDSTFEVRKNAGSGTGSATWWVVVEGTTRPRIDPDSPD